MERSNEDDETNQPRSRNLMNQAEQGEDLPENRRRSLEDLALNERPTTSRERSSSICANEPRYPDGRIHLRNPNLELMNEDILYHLALGSGSHDLVSMFGDIKFVCMGGTPRRAKQFAYFIMEEIGLTLPAGTKLVDISQVSHRYSMYKVGPVLSISHGMGIPSVGILLHEIIKLMFHARAKDPIFFRIGTSGGIGIQSGTVIISEEVVDGLLNPYYELPILGNLVQRPALLDQQLIEELLALRSHEDFYDTVVGRTMCTTDFYEGQGRLDGAFCSYSEAEKMEYLLRLQHNGVVNIEMESLAFAALTHHAGIKSAVICVAIIDRLQGDQIRAPKEVLDEWQMRPQKLVSRYIKRYLEVQGQIPLDDEAGARNPRLVRLMEEEPDNYE